MAGTAHAPHVWPLCGIVVGLFVVCWLPSLVTSFAHYFSKRVTWPKVWVPVEAVAFTSSAINPWVYCLRNEEFYEALTLTFPFLRRVSKQKGFRRYLFEKSTNTERTWVNSESLFSILQKAKRSTVTEELMGEHIIFPSVWIFQF